MTEFINTPLSNVDINQAVKQFEEKGANIVQDNMIRSNTPIEDIFKNRGHAVLFHKYPNQEVGHWYTLIRDPQKNVFVIDSLGKPPAYYNKNLIQCFKNNDMNQVIINKQKMQHSNSSVCGRYSILFCVLNKMDKNIHEIYSFMEAGKKKNGSFDKFVLSMTT